MFVKKILIVKSVFKKITDKWMFVKNIVIVKGVFKENYKKINVC